ncbi:MAG TPA: GNAT family N-acetyltransferase [Caulobacteraceae bacterium]|nr:GNAT family N-acetyltransferase [Caulobacteraceae bacterium]
MILRRAALDDMPALARLHRLTVESSLPFVPQLHTPEEDAWWFAERLFAANEVWLAEDGKGAAGYVAFRADFIEHLFVRPDLHGAGLGLQLLDKAREASAEVSLWTFQQNERARRFYERHGFVVALETDGADNEEKLPDVLYRWRRAGA